MKIEIAQPTHRSNGISAGVTVDGHFSYQLTSQEIGNKHLFTLTKRDDPKTIIAQTTTQERYDLPAGHIHTWVTERILENPRITVSTLVTPR